MGFWKAGVSMPLGGLFAVVITSEVLVIHGRMTRGRIFTADYLETREFSGTPSALGEADALS
jgi:hypothetical protein